MRFILIGRSGCTSLAICAQAISFSVVDTLVTIVIKMPARKANPSPKKAEAAGRIEFALKVPGLQRLPTTMLLDKFKKAITDNTLQTELGKAYAAVKAAVPLTPSGKSCPARSADDVKTVARSNGPDQSVLFSGSLAQLNLLEVASSTVDCGRIC